MKRFTYIIILHIAAIIGFHASAANDYATIFKSWGAILANEPDTILTKIHIEIESPYNINVKALDKKDKTTKKILDDEALAVAINDSVWFVNTHYLNAHYSGIALPYMKHYAPLYFNDKIAYTQYSNETDNAFLYQLSIYVNKGIGTVEALKFLTSYGFNFDNAYIFTINPKTKKVDAVNDSRMSQLLMPYLDIRKRYESMYYYTEPFVINYYFLEYVDRIANDDSVPYLLE